MWNFNSLFRVCLIFYIRFCELQKASGITPWKNATRYCAGPANTGCAQQTFTVQNKPAAVAPKPSPIISSFLELGRKLSMQPKFGGAENVVKTETQQTFVNGLLGFITLGIYAPLEALICAHNNCMEVAHRYGQLYLHCSLIYFWVPSSCFCIVISLSLRVK